MTWYNSEYMRIRSRPSGAEVALLEITRDNGPRIDFVITSETDKVRIGKGHLCDIAISFGMLARYQFRIDLARTESDTPGVFTHRCVAREDHIPRYGTTINGQPLGLATRILEDGDLIEVPGVRIRFKTIE